MEIDPNTRSRIYPSAKLNVLWVILYSYVLQPALTWNQLSSCGAGETAELLCNHFYEIIRIQDDIDTTSFSFEVVVNNKLQGYEDRYVKESCVGVAYLLKHYLLILFL